MIARLAIVASLVASSAAAEPGLSYRRLYVRAGLAHISPLTRSRALELSDVHGPASLAVMDGPVAGSGATLDAVTVPAVIVGYVLPVLHDRLSIETVLGAPFRVRFRATGTLANMSIAPEALGIPTGVPALGSALGEAEAAPPMLTVVYRPLDLGPVHPYIGAGVAALVSYDAHATNPILTEAAQPKFDIAPALGIAFQTGLDVKVWRNVVARLDIKYIALMKARATVEHIQVRTPDLPLFDTVEVGTATMEMWINPLVVQLGVGADF